MDVEARMGKYSLYDEYCSVASIVAFGSDLDFEECRSFCSTLAGRCDALEIIQRSSGMICQIEISLQMYMYRACLHEIMPASCLRFDKEKVSYDGCSLSRE
jgi:hypothetical protein